VSLLSIAQFQCNHCVVAIVKSLADAHACEQVLVCALCLSRTGVREVKAVTVANGFAVCREHLKAQAAGFVHRPADDQMESR